MPMDEYDRSSRYTLSHTLNVYAFANDEINKNKVKKFIIENNIEEDESEYTLTTIIKEINRVKLLFSSYLLDYRQLTSIGLRFNLHIKPDKTNFSKMWVVVNVFQHDIVESFDC